MPVGDGVLVGVLVGEGVGDGVGVSVDTRTIDCSDGVGMGVATPGMRPSNPSALAPTNTISSKRAPNSNGRGRRPSQPAVVCRIADGVWITDVKKVSVESIASMRLPAV